MKRRFLSALILLVSVSSVVYAQKRAFTIEDLYRIRSISDVRISPDGKSVAYVITDSDLPRAKRIGNLDDELRWQQCASIDIWAERRGITSLSRDGKSLLMISSRDGGPNLYILPLDGGEAKRLTNISPGLLIREGRLTGSGLHSPRTFTRSAVTTTPATRRRKTRGATAH